MDNSKESVDAKLRDGTIIIDEAAASGPLLGNTPAPAQEGPFRRVVRRASALAPNLAKLVSDAVYELAKPAKDAEKRPLTLNQLQAQNIVDSLSKGARNRIVDIVKSRGRNRHTRRATDAIIRRDARRQGRLAEKHAARAEAKEERRKVFSLAIHARIDRGQYNPYPGMTWDRYRELAGVIDIGGDSVT